MSYFFKDELIQLTNCTSKEL